MSLVDQQQSAISSCAANQVQRSFVNEAALVIGHLLVRKEMSPSNSSSALS